MDQVIRRATDAIDQLLESAIEWDSRETQLLTIRNLLNRLLEPCLPNNDWARVFCRQLKRLVNYDEILFEGILLELHDDILCVLNESTNGHDVSSRTNNFLKRMDFEEKLEQRELQFKRNRGEQKSLSELAYEYKEYFDKYLQKCIDLHSKVQVQCLTENIDDLLCRIYGLTEVPLTLKSRQLISEKLKRIDISIDCSNRSLHSLGSEYSINQTLSRRMNNDPNNFYPSQRINLGKSNRPEVIESILGSERWIVILGDPGCAKTTLLRWLTSIFAKAVQSSQEIVDFEGKYSLRVRVPILIRISEFAIWLAQYPTKTLMDFIGEHTWFLERYCDGKGEKMLKELIYHGHALVLLDGLDEIPELRRRSEIVDLVRDFVDEYIRAPGFVSAFDEKIYFMHKNLAEKMPPNKSDGNQVVITSRIVGYQFHPLDHSYIRHFTLSLMDHQEANKFVKNWIRRVHQSVHDVLLNEGIELGQEKVQVSSSTGHHAEKVIFASTSILLKSNPALLSLVCTFVFQSSDQIHLKSRIEVYKHAVQAVFHAWKNQLLGVSESVLHDFLIELAAYLHLQSPSGLIDGFDLEHLCCLTLKQQGVSNNRQQLREYANRIVSILECNSAIVAEAGLQVYGFLHLSFQEYFVAQALVRGSDIKKIAKRILSFAINPRFRESLLLSFAWISWQWSFDKYDQFCTFVVSEVENQCIPFGTLLFFDAIDDLHRLPSNSIIFIALNSLLNHPSYQIRKTYVISSLAKLPEDILIEWMRLHLKDDQYLLKFCQLLPIDAIQKSIPSAVYQQLWAFHNRSSSTEFLIDQALRKTMTSADVQEQIFNKDFSTYLLSHNTCASDIHPLITSVIIAVCGGVFFQTDHRMIKIDYSFRRMHRESSILAFIIEYLDNNKETHLAKVQILIEQCESVLRKSSLSDRSVDITDTFIALLCLQGLSKPLIYGKYAEYQALPLALERLRRMWFCFKDSCKTSKYDCSITLELESIMSMFFVQSNQCQEQCTSFAVACESVGEKLEMPCLSKRLNIDISHNSTVSRSFQGQLDFTHLIAERMLDRITNDIYPLQMLQMDLLFLITFLPLHLQQLYYDTIISPTNKADSLPLVVFLSQCLTYFEHIDKNDVNPYLTISMLQPLFKEYMLENYARVLFWENYPGDEFIINSYEEMPSGTTDREEAYEVMKLCNLLDPLLISRPENWDELISEECQRIERLKTEFENEERDIGLFAASISLARLLQAKYRAIKTIAIASTGSREVHFAATNILDPVLRIMAFSIISNMKDPLVFDEELRDQWRCEMMSQFQSLLPRLSLLTFTFLFIECYAARHASPVSFQYMSSVVGDKLNETSSDQRCQGQEGAYIALKQLHDASLSPYLSQFVKQKENLSDVLQFNSTTFYRYFTNTTSFGSSNLILLSMMYLVELTFDAHTLDLCNVTREKKKISSFAELKELWNDLSENTKIMTSRVALWITNYLHASDRQNIHRIIEDISSCSMIERKALPVIETWLDYRIDKSLRFFAHYAALQFLIEGSSVPCLIDIVEEMLLTDRKFRLRSVMECLFTSPLVDLTVLRQILVILRRNIRYTSRISVVIDRREIFDVILQLELERITTNMRQPSETSTKSFLSLFKGCSGDLQVYLAEHLRAFIETYNQVDDTITAEYVASVIKWVIKGSVSYGTKQHFTTELYNCIFVLLFDRLLPQIQKAILHALNSLFNYWRMRRENIFVQNNAIKNLEAMIYSWNTYSEDMVAICLLVYGNCLLKLQKLQMARTVSDEMKNLLITFFETSTSEVISIRANFCLIFSHQLSITRRTMSKWFKGEANTTCERIYKILLQQTLFDVDKKPVVKYKNETEYPDMTEGFVLLMDFEEMNGIVEHIEANFAALIDTFVTDLYNYLCNNDTRRYDFDPLPNYINIANELCAKKSDEFCNAVRKSSFGEAEFKRRLCLCSKNKSRDIRQIIELYCVFGTITVEILNVIERIENDKVTGVVLRLQYLKQLSDEVAMEKLFQLLNSITSRTKLEISSDILRFLARIGAISLSEVHKKVSLMNSISDDDERWRDNENIIFDLLSSFGCFQKFLPVVSEERFFTVIDIDEEFEGKM